MYNNNLLQEEILESINKIDQVTMEAEYNVLNALLNDYHKSMMIYEQYQGNNIEEFTVFQECFVQEGFSDIVKKGIDKGKAVLIKIWNVIKKLLVFISRQVMRLINFLKRIFKKGVKSADQILDELGVKPYKSIFTESVKYEGRKISIPRNSLSQINLPDITLISKNIIIKFNRDKSFTLTSDVLTDHIDLKNKEKISGASYNENIKSQHLTSPDNTMYVIKILNDLRIFDEFINLIIDMHHICLGDNTNIEDFNKKVNDWMKGFRKIDLSIQNLKPVTIETLMKIQSRLSNANNFVQTFKDPQFKVEGIIGDETISSMNALVIKLESFQCGLNNISGALQNILLIDATFVESIKDVSKLAEFVSELIKSGVPSKYVAYNSWLVSDKSIKGNDENYNPIWGQSRVVFFPDKEKDFIYKIALNGIGSKGNHNECRITNVFKDDNRGSLISPVIKSFYDYNIIKMKRLIVDKENKPGFETLFKIRTDLQKRMLEKGYSINISSDIHEGNVGLDPETNDWVVMDYGYVIRNMSSIVLPTGSFDDDTLFDEDDDTMSTADIELLRNLGVSDLYSSL